MLAWPGPRTIPMPALPKAVARPSSPTIGNVFGKQLRLKYVFRLLRIAPDVVNCGCVQPGAICARSVVMP